MRDIINKLEDQSKSLRDYKKTRNDLRDKINGIMS